MKKEKQNKKGGKNMLNTYKTHDKNNQGVNPVAAAVTGAVVGAGVAVAGTIALQDEGNRKKVKNILTVVKKQALDRMNEMQKQMQHTKGDIEEKVTVGKKEGKKLTNATKTSLHKVAKN